MEKETEGYVRYENYSDIADIVLWSKQRDLDRNLVNKIVAGQLEYYNKYGIFTFPGTLVVIDFNEKYYLIDGQHRFQALKILYEQYHYDIEIAVQTYECNDGKRVDELYCMLNNINGNNCMVKDGKIDPDGEKLKQIRIRLRERYGYEIWDDNKSIRPYVNVKLMDEELKNSKFFQIKTIDEIIAAIEEQNDNYAVVLRNTNRTDYNKAVQKGGFVLQYKEAKARWIRTLF